MEYIAFSLLLVCVFFMIRNFITYECRCYARGAIFKYCGDLIEIGKYDMINYFEIMMVSYGKHMFSVWLWGKYSAVKPEYLEILKPYFE